MLECWRACDGVYRVSACAVVESLACCHSFLTARVDQATSYQSTTTSHTWEPLCSSFAASVQAETMSADSGDEATGPATTPLTRADIPELVKAVAEALSKKDSPAEHQAKEGERSSFGGELFVRRAISNNPSSLVVITHSGRKCK